MSPRVIAAGPPVPSLPTLTALHARCAPRVLSPHVHAQAIGTMVDLGPVEDAARLTSAERECRGIVFDAAGAIISRPMPYLAHLGPRDSARLTSLPTDDRLLACTVIAPGVSVASAWSAHEVQWLTRDVDPTVAAAVDDSLTPAQRRLVLAIAPRGFTFCGTWGGDEPAFTLLAIRHNVSGEFMPLETVDRGHAFSWPTELHMDADTLREVLEVGEFEGVAIALSSTETVLARTTHATARMADSPAVT